MSRGLPTSGTIYLSQIKNAFHYDSANVRRTDTITTAANSSVTAPSDANFVKIELWGGGGGGRGYNALGAEYGGGGGAYTSIILPCNSSTVLYYTVGAGGTGGTSGSTNNSTSGADTKVHANSSFARMPAFFGFYADGGGAGWTVSGPGGSAQTMITNVKDFTSTGGGNGTTTAGGSAAGGGGAGGATSGAAGTAPGGGGAPGLSSGVSGGNGAVGKAVFTWYGKPTVNNLRSYLAGGGYVRPGAAGETRNIPASGTINIRDFISAEEIGLVNNTASFFHQHAGGGTQYANCRVYANGTIEGVGVYNDGYGNFGNWMRSIFGDDSSTVTQHFDVMFNRTSASGYDTTLYGSAANTWIQCSTEPSWNAKTFLSGYGDVTSTHSGYLAFRRRSDNVVVANMQFTISVTAEEFDPGDTK